MFANRDNIGSLLDSAMLISSSVTTLAATFLISLRIILTTRHARMHHTYAKIVEILVESAALVSIFVLFAGGLNLANSVHPFDLETAAGKVLYEVLTYLSAIQSPMMVSVCYIIL